MTGKELEELKDKVKLNFYYDCFDYDGDEHTSLDLDGEYLISLIEAEQQRRVPSEDAKRAIATVQERWSETNGNKEYFEECGNQKEAVSACVKDMKDLDLAITALQQLQGWIPVSERLPEERHNVLLFDHKSKFIHVGYYYIGYENIKWCADDEESYRPIEAFSHWMPLPPKP